VLIADSLNHRVIEVSPTLPSGGTIVWQYGVSGVSGNGTGHLNQPYDAQRLSNGDTLIAERGNNRISETSPLRWNFVSPPINALAPGRCGGPLVLGVQDAYGAAASAPQSGVLALGAPVPFTFYADSACTQNVTSLPIASGTSQLEVYVASPNAGVYPLTASAPGYLPTNTFVRLAQPATLVFASSPLRLLADTCAPIPMVLVLHDNAGLPVVPSAPVNLSLESNLEGLRFYTSPDCHLENPNPTWDAGAASFAVYVKGRGHQASVSVSAPSLIAAQQPVTFISVGCSASGASLPGSTLSLALLVLSWARRSRQSPR
jgi:hypothetical protein